MTYLKHCVIAYVETTDSATHARLVPVLGQIPHFTEAEQERARAALNGRGLGLRSLLNPLSSFVGSLAPPTTELPP